MLEVFRIGPNTFQLSSSEPVAYGGPIDETITADSLKQAVDAVRRIDNDWYDAHFYG